MEKESENRIERVLFGPRTQEVQVADSPKRKNYIPISLLVFSLIFLGAFYFIREWKVGNTVDVAKNTEVKSDTQTLVAEVSKLISLPQDEEPTVATVSDPQMLKDQAFFANAKIGYKVLIYAKAKKAVLYDPVNQKIVEVAPLNIQTK